MIERRIFIRQVIAGNAENNRMGLATLSPEAILVSKEPANIGTPAKRKEVVLGTAPKMDLVGLLSELGQQAPELKHLIIDTMTNEQLVDLVDALEVRQSPRKPDLKVVE